MWLYSWILLLAGVACSLHLPRHQHGRKYVHVHRNGNLKYGDGYVKGRIHSLRKAEIFPPDHADKQDFIGRIRREILAVHDDIESVLDTTEQKKYAKANKVKRQANDIGKELLEAKLKKISDKLIKILVVLLDEEEPRKDQPKPLQNNSSNGLGSVAVRSDQSEQIKWLNLTQDDIVKANVSSDSPSNINDVNAASNNSNTVDNNATLRNYLDSNRISQIINDIETKQSDAKTVDNTNDSSLAQNNLSVRNQEPQPIASEPSHNVAIQQSPKQNVSVVETPVVANNVVDTNVVAKQPVPEPYPPPQLLMKKRAINAAVQRYKRKVREILKEVKTQDEEFAKYVPMKHKSKRNLDVTYTNEKHYNNKKKRQIPVLGQMQNFPLLPDLFRSANNFINSNINRVLPPKSVVTPLHTSVDGSVPKDGNGSGDGPIPYTIKDDAVNKIKFPEDKNSIKV